jgi:ribosomal-protein-alanine N-acetyltransferase
MFELHTERLRIIPLDLERLTLFIEDFQEMEKSLDLVVTNEVIEEHVKKAMTGLLQKANEDKGSCFWNTNWQIVLKEENRAIGGACFKGFPNEKGEVEVGYGINQEYQNNGYMTEALKAMSEWAFGQQGVLHVIAETDKTNISSQRVLNKTGLKMYGESKDHFLWKSSKVLTR